jgi:hypothetical protein
MTRGAGAWTPGKDLIFIGYKPVTLMKIGLAGSRPVSFTVLIW